MRISILFLVLALVSCKNLPEPLAPLPPYEDYLRSLEKADLLSTRIGRQWSEAGDAVFLRDTVPLDLPFTISAFFDAAEPAAHGYRFHVLPGQKLNITGQIQADGRVFSNLFIRENDGWNSIASSDSTISFSLEFDETTSCLLRIQPELLVTAHYSLLINRQPALLNPVSGAENRDIGSVYGDPRDGGNRSHEGVDIFAPRGTPVIAPAAGRISRIQTTNLGGKVVWMRDQDRNQSYYFAHLDSQLVSSGRFVETGDTVGLVGNTGNARNTPPHLHFGIYRRGSRDPMSYIRTLSLLESMQPLDSVLQSAIRRVGSEKVNMRTGPSTDYAILRELEKNDYVEILGKSGDWVHILLPDNSRGYLDASFLRTLDELSPVVLPAEYNLLTNPDSTAIPLPSVNRATGGQVLAKWENYHYILLENDMSGWVGEIPPTAE